MLKLLEDALCAPDVEAPWVEGENPIARLGAIGDGRTVALVRDDTSIPYLCWPLLDSPPVLDAILSGDAWCHAVFTLDGVIVGGRQRYLDGTNVLQTVLERNGARVVVTDAMPLADTQRLWRRVVCEQGTVRLGFHLGHRSCEAFGASASFALERTGHGLRGDVALKEGDAAWVAFHHPDKTPSVPFDPSPSIERTSLLWRERIAALRYEGPRRALVERSILAMWLCERVATGGLAAAATFAFPEAPGGERNWDYRYAWVRDTALAARAAARAGLTEDAMRWLRFVVMENDDCERSPIRLMQTLDAGPVPDERTLRGYRGLMDARPVQVGNGAESQLQLDIFGEIMLALRTLGECGVAVEADMLAKVRSLLGWLKVHWNDPDSSIWELRGGEKRYLFSALMAWIAFRDATHVFETNGETPDPAWSGYADKIAVTIRRDYWCPKQESYMQTSECSVVDAAVVMMRLCGFLEGDDPRWHASKRAIRRDLLRPDPDPHGLLRYPHHAADGFTSDEGTFMLCTGWWVQALWLDGERDEARATFEAMIARLGPTGLASEEIGENGELWGNVPQMFSHAAIVDCVLTLYG